MPFFQLDDSSLVPFQRQAISSGVYEEEIEGLLWDNLEELTGENLFRVARQPVLPLGRPDVVALDAQGRVVVIEVKRDARWASRLSFYTRYGDWFILLCGLLILVGYFSLFLSTKEKNTYQPGELLRPGKSESTKRGY